MQRPWRLNLLSLSLSPRAFTALLSIALLAFIVFPSNVSSDFFSARSRICSLSIDPILVASMIHVISSLFVLFLRYNRTNFWLRVCESPRQESELLNERGEEVVRIGDLELRMGMEEGAGVDKKITIGVCVMEKKVKCSPEVFFPFRARVFALMNRWLRLILFESSLPPSKSDTELDFFFSLIDCSLQVFSAPMGQIMDRLQAFGEFEVTLTFSRLMNRITDFFLSQGVIWWFRACSLFFHLEMNMPLILWFQFVVVFGRHRFYGVDFF